MFLASESGFTLFDLEKLTMQRFFALYKVCMDAAKKRESDFKSARNGKK